MFKVLSLMKRKEGMSREEFYRWAKEEHPKIALQMPGLRAYRANPARLEEPEAMFDGISEMWFDDLAGFEGAFASPEGSRAKEDAIAHASQRVHIRADEIVLL